MSNLYASVDGDRGKTTTKASAFHLAAHVRGWDRGIRVVAQHTKEGTRLQVELTPGSNNAGNPRLLATVEPDGTVKGKL